jgi:multidrug transporter EmrE-like cation transporter
VVFAGAYLALPGQGTLRVAMGQLNWTALALGLVVVFLDLAFLMMYRGGFNVSLGQIISQSGTALLLLLIGVAFFSEKLSLTNIAGIGLCIAGLWLISQK